MNGGNPEFPSSADLSLSFYIQKLALNKRLARLPALKPEASPFNPSYALGALLVFPEGCACAFGGKHLYARRDAVGGRFESSCGYRIHTTSTACNPHCRETGAAHVVHS